MFSRTEGDLTAPETSALGCGCPGPMSHLSDVAGEEDSPKAVLFTERLQSLGKQARGCGVVGSLRTDGGRLRGVLGICSESGGSTPLAFTLEAESSEALCSLPWVL